MTQIPQPDLWAPWQNATLLQIRTSKMKQMRDLTIFTGIYKQPRTTRVFCSFTGLESDEHDLTFHGGVDKAVHQYFPGHYQDWKREHPEAASAFEVGGFGENLVCNGGMNERNVCIGDIIRVGGTDGVLLQISLPRQPCFKLNHRFGLKNFAAQTWKKSRTGWYYRVLKEGWMEVGDEVTLVERKYLDWTIERVQEYLHRDKENLAKLMELEKIDEFGHECKSNFKSRVAKLKAEEEEKANGGKKKELEVWEEFEVVEKKAQTKRITSFTFEKPGKGEELDPGMFARLKLSNGLIRPYSIVGGTTHRFQLGIALDKNSRGGSRYLDEKVKQGDKILVGKLTASVPVANQASNHIFFAGGIGITAFLSHIDVYSQINFNYTLHYAVRSAEDIPFKPSIEKMGSNVVIYDRSKGERMDILQILQDSKFKFNSFIYASGPQRMIDDIVRSSSECGMSQDEIHYEAFQIETRGDPFTVEIKKTALVLTVDEDKTLLQTIREAGLEVDSSCETGNCATCRVEVCEGKVDHRGSGLGEEDKATAMLTCVSRGIGHIVIDF